MDISRQASEVTLVSQVKMEALQQKRPPEKRWNEFCFP